MRRLSLTLAGLSIAVFVAGGAAAQDTEIGSRLKPRRGTGMELTPKDSIIAARRFAGCLVMHRKDLARRYMAATTTGEVDAIEGNLSRDLQCPNLFSYSDYSEAQSLRMSVDVRRGMIAEALIEADYGTTVLPPLPIQHVYRSGWSDVSGRAVAVEEMAKCVAETNPASVGALLHTVAGSREEGERIGALTPSIGQWLVQTAKLNANAVGLRAALAEELYHRLATPVAANAVVGR